MEQKKSTKQSLKKRVHKRFEASALTTCWNKVKDRKKTIFYTMLIDLLFLGALYLLNIIANKIFPDPAGTFIGASSRILLTIILMLVYVFIIVIAYSFFKFLILKKIRSLFDKEKLDFSMFDTFLFSNTSLLGILFLISVFISLLSITTIKIEALATVRDAILMIIGIFGYLLINTAHSLFAQGTDRAGTIIKESFNLVIGNFRKFIPLIIFTTTAFFLLAGAYYLFDWALLKILGDAIANTGVYLTYATINTILIFILAFGLVAFNRVYFYTLINKIKSKTI